MTTGYRFSSDPDELDRGLVHRWLSEQAYWALGRTRQAQDAAIDASRNYGVYRQHGGEQVAYARVLTDGTTFAWLCDVFVDPSVRGNGVGKLLLAGVVADLDSLPVQRTVLFTADAHGLYQQYGFGPPEDPGRVMIRTNG